MAERKKAVPMQMELLIDILEKNTEMIRISKYNPKGSAMNVNKLWQVMTESLNTVTCGAIKDTKGWQEAWKNLKSNTKKRERLVKSDKILSGDGPPRVPPLSHYEERVLALVDLEIPKEMPSEPQTDASNDTHETSNTIETSDILETNDLHQSSDIPEGGVVCTLTLSDIISENDKMSDNSFIQTEDNNSANDYCLISGVILPETKNNIPKPNKNVLPANMDTYTPPKKKKKTNKSEMSFEATMKEIEEERLELNRREVEIAERRLKMEWEYQRDQLDLEKNRFEMEKEFRREQTNIQRSRLEMEREFRREQIKLKRNQQEMDREFQRMKMEWQKKMFKKENQESH